MGKRGVALALALLGAVSALCLDGMKKVGKHIEERTKKEQEHK